MKKALLVLFVVLWVQSAWSQCGQPGLYCMQDGTINACTGSIFDAGGGSAYPDTHYTMTICPDNPGDVIQLDFSAFALQTSPGNGNSDYLSIFDGDSNAANSLGDYTGTGLQGLQVTGTVSNVTGCLTLVFDPNGAANTTFPGFEAQISCTTPCAPPTANSFIANPTPNDPTIQTVSVCMDSPVSFSGVGSSAAPGFTLANYIWNFDDGTVDASNQQNITHTFTEPGEYIVSLTVEDNNGCQSLNINPLQVLVSTLPIFSGIESQETCFGETMTLDGSGTQNVTWTALPPQVVAGTTYLADGAGFSYSTSLEFDFFEPDAVLESCDDLLGVLVNMEHSYMGDLGIFITCPNGTTVSLVEWGVNGGGGTFLGEAIDDGGTDPGIGYDYTWAPTASNGTWGENAGGTSLPSGTYEAYGDLCDMVGCPLNGAWTFSVTDNLAIDNGYIFYWGINFNPALFPGVTTFTPTIGIDADSSYWTGPNISEIDFNADVITIDPPAPGTYDYTYHVVNSFGCEFDTTISVTFTQPLLVTAGPDQVFACGSVELQGSFVGMPAPACSTDSGDYNYCPSDNDFQTWTFCPDDPGDGTAMNITFNAGTLETCCDFITIYDGEDTTAPVLASFITGTMAGQTWTATNTTGCLTMTLDTDGSVSCGSGAQVELEFTVGCGNGGPQYTWIWTPDEFLDDPSIPTPDVISLDQQTTFTLVGYPVGHPDCESTDDVVVSIDPMGDPGLDNTITICSTDPSFDMRSQLLGNPTNTGVWSDATGTVIADGQFDPATMMPGDYTHTVTMNNCETSAVLTIEMALPTELTMELDTAICLGGSVDLAPASINNGQAPFQYEWTYNGSTIGVTSSLTYSPTITGDACLTITDDCGFVITACRNIIVEQPVTVLAEVDTSAACYPYTFTFTNLVDPSLYNNSLWTFSDGTTVANDDEFTKLFDSPGVYDVTLLLTSAIGCTYEATFDNIATQYALPIAEFYATPQPTDALNTTIQFHDLSVGTIETYEWLFDYPAAIGGSAEQNPIFEFPLGVGGTYPVQLTVTDIHNCTDIYLGDVVIADLFQYYIPNSFTPNGDGINDVWQLYGTDIDESRFVLQVFNHWGDVIFETADPNVVWTGAVKGGDYFAQDGIYQWRAKVISKTTGERKELEGHLLLLR
ncbi:MAG: PKD domain-containing protein [Flavobacteriales bacterium]